jgi:hypothetical protein
LRAIGYSKKIPIVFLLLLSLIIFLLMEVEAVDIALEIGMSEKYFMKKPI